jgi:hypothetical protein
MKLRSALFPLLALSACGPTLIERRADELRSILTEAQSRGAASCAPVELALSSVHLEFAQLEQREGDEARAERHLILAEPNGKAALRRTKEGDCHASATASSATGSSGSSSPVSDRDHKTADSAHPDEPVVRPSNTSRPARVAAAQGHKSAER